MPVGLCGRSTGVREPTSYSLHVRLHCFLLGPKLSLVTCTTAREYLALGTMTDDLPVGAFAATAFTSDAGPLRGLVQIWSFDVSGTSERQRIVSDDVKDRPTARFDLGLCVDVGQPWALQWCPRGGHAEDHAASSVGLVLDLSSYMVKAYYQTVQLGLLAGVFTDGKVHIFDVPKHASETAEYRKPERETRSTDQHLTSVAQSTCDLSSVSAYQTPVAPVSIGHHMTVSLSVVRTDTLQSSKWEHHYRLILHLVHL